MNSHFIIIFISLITPIMKAESSNEKEIILIEICANSIYSGRIKNIIEQQTERYKHLDISIFEHQFIKPDEKELEDRIHHCVESIRRIRNIFGDDKTKKNYVLVYVDDGNNSSLPMKQTLVSMGVYPFVVPFNATQSDYNTLELNIARSFEAIIYYHTEPMRCLRQPHDSHVDDNERCESVKLFHTCEFQCRTDFYKPNTVNLFCDHYGQWKSMGECEPHCVDSPVIDNAKNATWCTNRKLRDECDFECPQYYLKNGSNYFCSMINKHDYGWEGDGSCIKNFKSVDKTCERTIPNGYISDASCRYRPNGQCNYDCNEGYEKKGYSKLRCIYFQGIYTWSVDGVCLKKHEQLDTSLEVLVQEHPCKINFFICADLTRESESYFEFLKQGLLGVSVDSNFIDARRLMSQDFKFREPLNMERCLDNIIQMSSSSLAYGIKVVITNKIVSPRHNKALILNGFLPFLLRDFRNRQVYFQRVADNFCYYKTNPLYCQTVPKIWNADFTSLHACIGTLFMESCEFRCQPGYASKKTKLNCMYQGRWYNEYLSVRQSDLFRCIKINSQQEGGNSIANRNQRDVQYCSLKFYVCSERSEEKRHIIESNLNKLITFSTNQNNFDFVYINEPYSNGYFDMFECFDQAQKISSDENKVMVYYSAHGDPYDHSIKSSLISRGFYPFKAYRNISHYKYQTILTNMCYRPMVCPKAPVVINAKTKSLEDCKGTALLQSCRFECKNGYVTSFPYMMCLYKGVWGQQNEVRACLKNACDFIPSIENALSTDHCMGMAIGQVCMITCKPGYYNPGSDFTCSFDPINRNRLTWVGNGTCYKYKRGIIFE